jgi:hypothetical protein
MADLNTESQNGVIDELANQFDRLEIRASDETVLVTFTISWAAVSGGSISVSGTPITAQADATGEADHARLRHSSNAEVMSDISIGTSGTILTLNTTSIESGKDVDLESLTMNAPTTLTTP